MQHEIRLSNTESRLRNSLIEETRRNNEGGYTLAHIRRAWFVLEHLEGRFDWNQLVIRPCARPEPGLFTPSIYL